MGRKAASLLEVCLTSVVLFVITLIFAVPTLAVTYPGAGVPVSDAPWAVQILSNDITGGTKPRLLCTGVIISPVYVLTAAHCIKAARQENFSVGVGGADVRYIKQIQVLDYMLHPDYVLNFTQTLADIALLRLAEPVDIVPLPITGLADNHFRATPLSLYGWGVDENRKSATNLGFASLVEFVSRPVTDWFPKFQSMFQIATISSQSGSLSSPCAGDSGGPLVGFDAALRPALIGLMAYEFESCAYDLPSIFTRVAPYAVWIAESRIVMDQRAGAQILRLASPGYLTGSHSGDGSALLSYVRTEVSATDVVVVAEMPISTFSVARTYKMRVEIDTNFDGIPEAYLSSAGLVMLGKVKHRQICPAISIIAPTADALTFTVNVSSVCLRSRLGNTAAYNIILESTQSRGRHKGRVLASAQVWLKFVTVFPPAS